MSYSGDKVPSTYAGLLQEVQRLRAISERQSEMLALALKEKNDLLVSVHQMKRLQHELKGVQGQLQDITNRTKYFVQSIERFAKFMEWK